MITQNHPAMMALENWRDNNEDFKQVSRDMARWHIKHKPTKGIYCPLEEVFLFDEKNREKYEMIVAMAKTNPQLPSFKMAKEFFAKYYRHAFYGTWENTLGIYKIDPDLYEQLASSVIPDDTPSTIFERLPEWCIYVELPHAKYAKEALESKGRLNNVIHGFWVRLDTITKPPDTQKMLQILVNFYPNEHEGEYWGYINEQSVMSMPIVEGKTIEEVSNRNYELFGSKIDRLHYMTLKALLTVLLMLCAEKPDISDYQYQPISRATLDDEPRYKRHKRKNYFIPPRKPRVLNVGARLGGEIRQFNRNLTTEVIGEGTGRTVRPHIRKGHWHGVWTGTGNEKEFKVYWQPAIFVKG